QVCRLPFEDMPVGDRCLGEITWIELSRAVLHLAEVLPGVEIIWRALGLLRQVANRLLHLVGDGYLRMPFGKTAAAHGRAGRAAAPRHGGRCLRRHAPEQDRPTTDGNYDEDDEQRRIALQWNRQAD